MEKTQNRDDRMIIVLKDDNGNVVLESELYQLVSGLVQYGVIPPVSFGSITTGRAICNTMYRDTWTMPREIMDVKFMIESDQNAERDRLSDEIDKGEITIKTQANIIRSLEKELCITDRWLAFTWAVTVVAIASPFFFGG